MAAFSFTFRRQISSSRAGMGTTARQKTQKYVLLEIRNFLLKLIQAGLDTKEVDLYPLCWFVWGGRLPTEIWSQMWLDVKQWLSFSPYYPHSLLISKEDMWPRCMLGGVLQCPRNQPGPSLRNNELPSPPQNLDSGCPGPHHMEPSMNGARVSEDVRFMCSCVCEVMAGPYSKLLQAVPPQRSAAALFLSISSQWEVCACVCPLINSLASGMVFITRAGRGGFNATHWADWTD